MGDILDKKEVLDLVREKIAEEVVNSLTDEVKKAVLAEAVKELLSSWSFKREIENATREIALSEMHNYLKLPEVRERIRQQAIAAAEQFIAVLYKALLSTLLQSLDDSREYVKPKLYENLRKLLGIREKDC